MGDEVYIGYLKLLNNGREWQGYLDAENPDFLGGSWRHVPPQPHSGNTAPPSTRRASGTSTYRLETPAWLAHLSFFDYPGSGWNTNSTTDQATLQSLIDPIDPNGDGLATIQLLLNVGVPSGIFQYFRNTIRAEVESSLGHLPLGASHRGHGLAKPELAGPRG